MENNRLIKLRWGLVGLVFVLGGWLGLVSFPVRAMAPETLTWQMDVIDSIGDVGYTPSLALEPGTEKPHISYYDNTEGDLKLAFPVSSGGDCGPGNTWSCNSLNFQNTTNFGLYSSLDFNSLGEWGIAYENVDDGANEFRGVAAPGEEVFFEPIEEPALIFTVNNSMQFAANDVSQVSYGLIDINEAKGFVKYAHYVGQFGNCGYGLWQCDPIVQTTYAGFVIYNSLTISGFPFIFYRNINQHLSMAVSTASGNCGPVNDWECLEIDPTIAVNGGISSYSTYPEDGFFGVAYIGNDNLRYAFLLSAGQGNCGSGFWEFQCDTIDSVGAAPTNQLMGASLGEWNGQPIIAYTDNNDQGNTILKIAYPTSIGNCGPSGGLFFTWQCEVVDDGGGTNDVGFYPSLKVDSDGRIHLAYYDLTTGNLKYAVSVLPATPTPTSTSTPVATPTPTSTLTPTPTATPPPGSLSPRVYLPMLVR